MGKSGIIEKIGKVQKEKLKHFIFYFSTWINIIKIFFIIIIFQSQIPILALIFLNNLYNFKNKLIN